MARRGFAMLVLVLLVLVRTTTAGTAHAAPPAASAVAAGRATAPTEEEASDSPRASVRAYLDLCDKSRFEEAARYLDLPRGTEKRGADLAKKLFVVLGERLWIDPERLSGNAQGSKSDGLPQGTEELGKITDAKGHAVPIRLVRHDTHSAEDEARWVFAQSTVLAVDGLYASLSARWIREHLPAPLLEVGPSALYWWQWLAIPILGAICIAVGRLIAWVAGRLAQRLFGRWKWTTRFLVRLQRPVSVAAALALFWLAVPYLALTIKAEDLVERILRALGWLTFFWGLFRAVTVAGDEAQTTWAVDKPSVRSLASVGVRLGKVVVAALATMVALSELGYPVTSVIAGLGIGGIALALAAQKTVENLFGSVSILVDQPFQVGDTIRVDTVEGTVESIGLRSTRLRTVERTLIIIPNGKLADMRIESLGPRDRIRFSTKIQLGREATSAQLTTVASAIRAKLAAHESVKKEDIHVRLAAFGEHAYEIEVAAPIETKDAVEFAKIKEELLLDCVTAVEKAGLRLAVPARTIAMVGAKA